VNPFQFRATTGKSDAPFLIAIHEARAVVDGVSPTSPEEYRPTLHWYESELKTSNPQDWVVVEQNGEVIAYGHALWNWQERDGTEVYLHVGFVHPEFRGLGVGSELLEKLELRCKEKAKVTGHLANLEIAANANSSELAAQDLLRNHNYFVAFNMLEMHLKSETKLQSIPNLINGYELRPVLPEHYLAIWQCIGDSYDERNFGHERFAAIHRKEDYTPYFSGDSSLMFVVWELQSERIAGQVLCRILKNGNGEVFEVSVGVAHRKKGLARFLILTALHELRSRGVQMITLGTRADNLTQAWRLYESVGFETHKGFLRWRKNRNPIAS
jgi:mycothiol synthase